ncbi:hypothetical protein BZG72_13530 [Salinivibrio sp. PR6]|uniref:putative phage abortive infection protein n=1 Tax=Salinivibrio sp. PR6 TaxID=1909485 RepID=UPI000988BD25|nr:putative phage abortive infection protein [Salinivibrio sp. PR6]OOE79801.1 hypothetical protein BZG72_13530 [Salinivibrio sp. PR6]
MEKSETDTEIEKLQKKIKWSWWVAATSALLVIGFYFGRFVNSGASLSLDTTIWGGFGSYFGGILSPIVALFALYWLTQSVLIQKKELSETQETLRKTQLSHYQQTKTQEKKRFEDTFFSLLDQFNAISREMGDVNNSLYSHLTQMMNTEFCPSEETSGFAFLASKGNCIEYRDFSFNFSKGGQVTLNDLSHYFRVIYHILKFVESAECSSEKVIYNGKFYTNILRSFLGQKETVLLAFNCAVMEKSDPFYNYRRLIEKYEMLEHMTFNHRWIGLCMIYNKSAFGANEDAQGYYETMDELGLFSPIEIPRKVTLSSAIIWKLTPTGKIKSQQM